MPRPTPRTGTLPAPMWSQFLDSLQAYLASLSNADQLAIINKVRDGSLFNFTPTS
jgi:hypothetical protein